MVIDTSENPALWLGAILFLFMFLAFFSWWLADRVGGLEDRLRNRNRR